MLQRSHDFMKFEFKKTFQSDKTLNRGHFNVFVQYYV